MQDNLKCTECTEKVIQDYADLLMQYAKLKERSTIIDELENVERRLANFLQEENETLRNRIKFLEDMLERREQELSKYEVEND